MLFSLREESLDKLHLTVACGVYDRTKALQTGEVEPEGIRLNYIPLQAEEIFWRMSNFREFDASEMSLSNHITMISRGSSPFVAIPVFPSRFFRHSCVFINTESGIKRPEDFKGKKVGAPEYSITAAVWIRGFLNDEYGVKAGDMEWVFRSGGGDQAAGRLQRQKSRRAGIFDHGGGVDPRLLERRIRREGGRHGMVHRRPGRSRSERTREAQAPAGDQDERDRRPPDAQRHARARRHRRADLRAEPVLLRQRLGESEAALSELQGSRDGLLQADEDLPYHARARHPEKSRRARRGGRAQPLQSVLRREGESDSGDARLEHARVYAAVAHGRDGAAQIAFRPRLVAVRHRSQPASARDAAPVHGRAGSRRPAGEARRAVRAEYRRRIQNINRNL